MLPHTRHRHLTTSLAAAALLGPARVALAPTAPRFNPEGLQTLSTTISTASGDCSVIYRCRRAIPYAVSPIDPAHQSLNLSVPAGIDGQPIDAFRAPILPEQCRRLHALGREPGDRHRSRPLHPSRRHGPETGG